MYDQLSQVVENLAIVVDDPSARIKWDGNATGNAYPLFPIGHAFIGDGAPAGQQIAVGRTLPTKDTINAALERLMVLQVPVTPEPPKLRTRKIGKFLYIPIDVPELEFPHKAKIARNAADAGWQVLIGSAPNLLRFGSGDLVPGVFLVDSLTARCAKKIFKMACGGHITACLDDSGQLPDTNALKLIDYQLCAGPSSTSAKTKHACIDRFTPYTEANISGVPRETILVLGYAPIINAAGDLFDSVVDVALEEGRYSPDDMRDRLYAEHDALTQSLEVYARLKAKHGDCVRFKPHPLEDARRYPLEAVERRWLVHSLEAARLIVHHPADPRGQQLRDAGYPCVKFGAPLLDVGECRPRRRTEANLQQVLDKIHAENAYPMPFDMITAWNSCRREPYIPTPRELDRFPPLDESEAMNLFGSARGVTQLNRAAGVWYLAA